MSRTTQAKNLKLPLKAAVIGAGRMGQRHMKALMLLPNVRLVGAACQTQTSANKVEKHYGLPVITRWQDVLIQFEPDFVCICTPTELHYEMALYFLEQDISVLLEKPMVRTLKEAEQLIEITERKQIPLMVAHQNLFEPGMLEMYKSNRECVSNLTTYVSYSKVSAEFDQRETEHPGALYEVLMHGVYVMNRFCESTFKECTIQKYEKTSDKLAVEFVLFYEKHCGSLSFHFSALDQGIESLSLEKGAWLLEWKFSQGTSQISNIDETGPSQSRPYQGNRIQLMLKHFVSCVQNGTRPLEDARAGCDAIKVTQACLAQLFPKNLLHR